ncbi:hypothetical protein JY742_10585 [Clostridioides difficile]|nr:hypothetical protein [Clostridioides difficile]
MSVTIVDSMCGTGKTSWEIQTMNESLDKRYIYITPLSRMRNLMINWLSTFYFSKVLKSKILLFLAYKYRVLKMKP